MRKRSLVFDYAAYVAIAYLFTWTLVIAGVKLGWSEDTLNISGAGPTVAALILSRTGTRTSPRGTGRWLWFFGFLPVCWIILSLRTSWWASDGGLPVHLRLVQLIPAAAPAWILSALASRNDGGNDVGRRVLHRPNRWSAFAILFFPLFWGLPSAIAHGFGARLVWPGLGGVNIVSAATASIAFLSNILYAGLQEEPGWRGFLLDRLQSRFSPLSASLLVWLPWAFWHGPIDYYRPVRFTLVQEILLRGVTLIPITIILTWFYNRSHRSVQAVVFFHAAMNTFPYVVAYYPPGWGVMFLFAVYAVIKQRMWVRPTLPGPGPTGYSELITKDGSAHLSAPSRP